MNKFPRNDHQYQSIGALEAPVEDAEVQRSFNVRKATQVAGRILRLGGGRLPYISILKIMYFVDREAMVRWRIPVTNDAYFALDNGPILSDTMNLLSGEASGERTGYWSAFIENREDFEVELVRDPEDDQISRAEERLIDEIFAENDGLSRWQLVSKSHDLPEWQYPNGSRLPITDEEILRAAGFSGEELEDRVTDLEGFRRTQKLALE